MRTRRPDDNNLHRLRNKVALLEGRERLYQKELLKLQRKITEIQNKEIKGEGNDKQNGLDYSDGLDKKYIISSVKNNEVRELRHQLSKNFERNETLNKELDYLREANIKLEADFVIKDEKLSMYRQKALRLEKRLDRGSAVAHIEEKNAIVAKFEKIERLKLHAEEKLKECFNEITWLRNSNEQLRNNEKGRITAEAEKIAEKFAKCSLTQAASYRKECEGLNVEIDRLLEDNITLRLAKGNIEVDHLHNQTFSLTSLAHNGTLKDLQNMEMGEELQSCKFLCFNSEGKTHSDKIAAEFQTISKVKDDESQDIISSDLIKFRQLTLSLSCEVKVLKSRYIYVDYALPNV